MADLKPYSRAIAWANLDGRSREAVLLRRVRADLTAHLGGKPSATQRALIERAASLSLHIALLDAKALKAGGVMTDHDSRQYLAWSNALTRTLRQLGNKGVAATPRTLADIRAGAAA